MFLVFMGVFSLAFLVAQGAVICVLIQIRDDAEHNNKIRGLEHQEIVRVMKANRGP